MESRIQLLKMWELKRDLPEHGVIHHKGDYSEVIRSYITCRTLHNFLHGRKDSKHFTIISTGKFPADNDELRNYEHFEFEELFTPKKGYEGYMTGKNYGI